MREDLSLFMFPLKCAMKLNADIITESEVTQSCPTLCNPMDHSLTRLLRPWDFPGKSTEVGCHFLLQGIFPIQGPNLGLHHFCQHLISISLTFLLLWGVAIAEVSHIPPALTLQSLPTTNIPSFATINESRLTHYSHP